MLYVFFLVILCSVLDFRQRRNDDNDMMMSILNYRKIGKEECLFDMRFEWEKLIMFFSMKREKGLW